MQSDTQRDCEALDASEKIITVGKCQGTIGPVLRFYPESNVSEDRMKKVAFLRPVGGPPVRVKFVSYVARSSADSLSFCQLVCS